MPLLGAQSAKVYPRYIITRKRSLCSPQIFLKKNLYQDMKTGGLDSTHQEKIHIYQKLKLY